MNTVPEKIEDEASGAPEIENEEIDSANNESTADDSDGYKDDGGES